MKSRKYLSKRHARLAFFVLNLGLAVAGMSPFGSHSARAAAYTWTGATDTLLTTTTNYNPTLVLTSNVVSNGDTFTFDGTGANTGSLTIAAGAVFAPSTGIGLISLTSGQTAPVSVNSTATGGTTDRANFRLATGAGFFMDVGSGPLTLNATNIGGLQFTLGTTGGTTYNVTNNNATGGSAFTLGANAYMSPGGNSGTTRTVVFQGTGDFVINGRILNSGATGTNTGAITMSSTGMLTLAGNNTSTATALTNVGAGSNIFGLSGGVTLNSGTLNINNAGALGALNTTAGRFTINGGRIDNTSGGAITVSTNNPQTWGADFTFTGTNALNLGAGAVTLSASRQVTVSANTLTVGGVIGGAGFGLTKAGNGTLTLTGANTYTGGTTVNTGLLTAGATGTLGAGNVTVADVTGATLSLANNNAIADSAILSFGNNSKITLDAANGTSETVLSLTDTTTGLTLSVPGTYTDAQLNAQFGANIFTSSLGETITIAVPEPGAWVLMVGSIGMALGYRRIRRRQG